MKAIISKQLFKNHIKAQSFFSPNTIQPKLTIGQPNDKYEQEADAMADSVMRMPLGDFTGPTSGDDNPQKPQIQTKCAACEQEEMLQTKPLMMKQADGAGVATQSLTSQLNRSKGGGSPLPFNTNSYMSQAFGNDFSHVKIHTDSNAIQMNQGLNAKAFTHGSDIYFNKGEYAPNSSDGKKLLAHELTHVVQQGSKKLIQRQVIDDSNEARLEMLSASICNLITNLVSVLRDGRLLNFEIPEILREMERRNSGQDILFFRQRAEMITGIISALSEIQNRVINGEMGQDLNLPSTENPNLFYDVILFNLWTQYRDINELVPWFLSNNVPSPYPNELGVNRIVNYMYQASDLGMTHGNSPEAGILQSRDISTWWLVNCPQPQTQEMTEVPTLNRGTPQQLGLSPNVVIYLSGLQGERWDWEPRSSQYPVALGTIYEWDVDENNHVFIIVDSQRSYLLPNGIIERGQE